MFQICQQIVVKVMKVERSETMTKISLSMNPKDLHEFYNTTILKEDLVRVVLLSCLAYFTLLLTTTYSYIRVIELSD